MAWLRNWCSDFDLAIRAILAEAYSYWAVETNGYFCLCFAFLDKQECEGCVGDAVYSHLTTMSAH
jgi:hypothetical protein